MRITFSKQDSESGAEHLRKWARDAREAQSSIHYNSGPDSRSPMEFRLLRLILLTFVGVTNLLIYRNWRGKEKECAKEPRNDVVKERKCRASVASALAKASVEKDRGKRVRILKDATSRLRYVD